MAISILFIGISIAPSLHASNLNISNEELEEVVIELVSINDSTEASVIIPKKAVEDIDNLFESIKTELDNSQTIEDSIEIFNNALIKLENFGLLKDINSDQAQRLFFRNCHDGLKNRILQGSLKKLGLLHDNISCLCRIVGKATDTFFCRFSLIYLMSLPYMDIPPLPLPIFFLVLIFWGFTYASIIPWIVCSLFNFGLREFISFGHLEPAGYGFYPVPSKGWIRTRGLFGEKNTSGELLGKLPYFPLFIGVIGFTGIKIKLKEGYSYFLGFANLVMV